MVLDEEGKEMILTGCGLTVTKREKKKKEKEGCSVSSERSIRM